MIKLIFAFWVSLMPNWYLPQQGNGSEVYQFTSVAWYYGTSYARGPAEDATYLYFQGEPIGVKVLLYNEGKSAATITNVRSPLAANFRVEPLQVPNERIKTRLRHDFSSRFQRVPLQGRIDDIPHSARVTVRPGESIKAQFTIKTADGRALAPGIYRYRIRALPKVDSHPIKVNNDDFTFEVRPVNSFDDKVQVLARAVAADVSERRFESARQKINALLKLYPNSHIAYVQLGLMEYLRGQKKAAIAATEKAIELLRAGRDTLALKYNSSRNLEAAIGQYMTDVRAWRRELQ